MLRSLVLFSKICHVNFEPQKTVSALPFASFVFVDPVCLAGLMARRAITLLRLDKCHILQGVTDEDQAMARLDMFAGRWNVRGAWECFKKWVKNNKSKDEQLLVKALKPRPIAAVSSCTQKVVGAAVESLQALMKECGLLTPEGLFLASEADRLVCTDEKGFSQRSDQLCRAIVPRDLASTACTVQPSVSWEHLTLTSFLPCSGTRYCVGIVAPSARVHESWPSSDMVVIRCNKSGSTNSDIFANFLEAFAKQARQRIPLEKPIIICLDSGGGSWLHLSTKVVQVSLRYSLRPWFLPPWTTKGLMPLDQACRASMARAWSTFKKEWAQKGHSLSLHVTVKAVVEIAEECLVPKLALASWRHCGWTPGEKFNADKLFVERKNELFKSLKDADETAASGTTSLKFMRMMAPAKAVGSDSRFCPHCASPNAKFDKEKAQLLRSGARSGWRTAPAPEISESASAEGQAGESAAVLSSLADLMKDLRQRKRKRDEAGGAAAPEPPISEPMSASGACAASSASKEAPAATTQATHEDGVPDSGEEHDCDTVAGCADMISCYWPRSKRKEILVLARYYVETELKPQATKKDPLYACFYKAVTGLKVLLSKQGREKWAQTVSHNRKLRFQKIAKRSVRSAQKGCAIMSVPLGLRVESPRKHVLPWGQESRPEVEATSCHNSTTDYQEVAELCVP